MADAQITITGLTVTPGVKQLVLTWSYTIGSCLPYLGIASVEIWSATVNNFASATKIAEVTGQVYTHANLTSGVPRWYWVRPKDATGQFGDFFPFSATAGISGTPQKVTSTDTSIAQLSDISGNFGTILAGLIQSADGKMVIDLRVGFTKRIRIST